MPRDWPTPLPLSAPSKTVNVIGDIHYGAVDTRRPARVLADLTDGNLPDLAARVQIGDFTDDNTSGQDALALAYIAQLNALDGPDVDLIAGNHDLYSSRTRAQWATAYGITALRTRDLSFARLIFLSPQDNTLRLVADDLAWLDDQLTGTALDCWVFYHAPLYQTVQGPITGPNGVWSSAEDGFHVLGPTDALHGSEITDILAAHSNAKAWISGHTHSPIDAPGFVTEKTLGGKTVACVNTSAIFYTGRSVDIYDPIRSIFLTSTDDGIDVRVRDHGKGAWASFGPDRGRVQSVAL